VIDRRTTVLVVDDHPLFRHGISALIETAPDLTVVGQADSIEDVREIANRTDIQVAVVDILIPSSSGVGITRELRTLQRTCNVLALSVIDEPCIVAEMLRAGAIGFALKTQKPAEILDAIRATAAGTQYLAPRISHEAVELELARARSTDAHLTRREREIFELVIRGYTNTEIGSRLFIARRTVETHRHRIAKKLNARSLIEFQRMAALFGGLGT
jgi:DNA-binding NarL/FixJ family response regulator